MNKTRFEAFSGGVLAIITTIMILEIKYCMVVLGRSYFSGNFYCMVGSQ